jgi:hypothetical protein
LQWKACLANYIKGGEFFPVLMPRFFGGGAHP